METTTLQPIYSFVIPLYNRPDEIKELLESLTTQLDSVASFEVIVVEDGSTIPSDHIVSTYADRLDIRYIRQENTGPGGARNRGASEARGEWLIILDSDTVLPPGYLMAVHKAIQTDPVELWGGPDRAHEDFTTIQRAIDYSMTSFFTTGGIRGSSKRKLDRFYPRSFNMGVAREWYERVQGFRALRFGEDLDLSMRLLEAGARSACYSEAWLYHKRRVSYRSFFKQVYNSGIARITLQKLHPGSLKLVHLLPTLFVVGHIVVILLAILHRPDWLLLPLLYCMMIAIDLFLRHGSWHLAMHGILASYVQLTGYGLGFIHSFIRQIILRRGNFSQFDKHFYQ